MILKICVRFFVFFTLFCFVKIYASPCFAYIDGVRVDGECKGVLKHGEFIGYHRNGMPSWVVRYKNNVLHGKFYHFFPSGNLHFTGSYKNGKLDGPYRQYNVDNFMLKANFKHGVLHNWLYTIDNNNKKLEALKYYYGKLRLQKYLD